MGNKKRTSAAIGKQNRARGQQAERDVVHELEDAGVLAVRLSMAEPGHKWKGDIGYKRIVTEKDWTVCQVKNEQAIPDYIYKNLEGNKVLFMKKPRKRGWLVCLTLDYFKELL
jgi:hypothetical protein